MTPDTWIALGLLALGVLGLLGGIARWGLPPVVRFASTLNKGLLELTGTPDEFDRANKLVKPGTPSLSAQIGDIKVIISDQGKQNERITALETGHAALAQSVADLTGRVTGVEHLHQVERITGNVVQGKVVDAITEANRRRDVVDAESTEEPDTEL